MTLFIVNDNTKKTEVIQLSNYSNIYLKPLPYGDCTLVVSDDDYDDEEEFTLHRGSHYEIVI